MTRRVADRLPAGVPPEVPIDPQIRAILDAEAAAAQKPAPELGVEMARAQVRKTLHADNVPTACGVQDLTFEGIPARLYRPLDLHSGDEPGLIVFFHGGGFVAGDLDTHDPLTRLLCVEAGCVVLSVGYRLAPETKFPGQLDDCSKALHWAVSHCSELGADRDRILVAGDSAGANLAAAAALDARDRGKPRLAGLMLLYPVLDHYSSEYRSYTDFATGFGLTRMTMQWYWDQYLVSPTHGDDPRASPLRHANLSGLPDSFVATAECDVLRDEGNLFAERLKAAGVPTEAVCFEGLVHGFMRLADRVDAVRRAADRIVAWLGPRVAARAGTNTEAPRA